jgi:hypothetical protein
MRVVTSFVALAAITGLCVACGSAAPPSPVDARTASTAATPKPPAPPAPACKGAEDCFAQGKVALAAGDAHARELLGKACEGELRETTSFDTVSAIIDACVLLGRAYQSGKGGEVDNEKARAAFGRSCAGVVSSIDGCAWLVKVSRAGTSHAPNDVSLLRAAQSGCSTRAATEENRAVRGESCLVLASGTRGRTKERAFTDACTLGVEEGCTAAKALAAAATPQPATPSDVEGANLTMGGMTVDGVSLADIACKTDGGLGSLFGGMTVGVGFKSKKAKLDACSPKGVVATRVKWVSAGGRMTNVHATGNDASTNRCVERALAGAVATTAGVCAATVKHGRK